MRHTLSFVLVFGFFFGCEPKKEVLDVSEFFGVWVAEDYYNSIAKTQSPFLSRNAFDRWDPVALRLNPTERKGDTLHIGFANLAGKVISADVSEYTYVKGLKVGEDGFFKLVLPQKDSLGYYQTLPKTVQGSLWESQLRFDTVSRSIYYYRKNTASRLTKPIKYIQVADAFKETYPYPNPLRFYLINTLLSNSYELRDAFGNLLAPLVEFRDNTIHGFPGLNNFLVEINTDHYEPIESEEYLDLIIFCDIFSPIGSTCHNYFFEKNENEDLLLYNWNTSDRSEHKLRLEYILKQLKGKKVKN
ncbi:hypothetical protein [Aquimarina aggregata]|uniref:hypothetical protein n=1 Tax=Aquimarina aggregata TaxID=1642818 RepID=UPI002491D216|nr:hypothetical protein [Aquimarina aggregata]